MDGFVGCLLDLAGAKLSFSKTFSASASQHKRHVWGSCSSLRFEVLQVAPALLPAVPASGWPNAKPENVSLGNASMDQDLKIPEDTHKTTWRWPSDEDRPSDDVHTACWVQC